MKLIHKLQTDRILIDIIFTQMYFLSYIEYHVSRFAKIEYFLTHPQIFKNIYHKKSGIFLKRFSSRKNNHPRSSRKNIHTIANSSPSATGQQLSILNLPKTQVLTHRVDFHQNLDLDEISHADFSCETPVQNFD